MFIHNLKALWIATKELWVAVDNCQEYPDSYLLKRRAIRARRNFENCLENIFKW